MKARVIVAAAAVAVALGVGLAGAQVQVDPGLAAYKAVSGVSGNISSVGSDTLNNLMTLWAETFQKFYPNAKIQIEGKGSSTAPPALIAGTAQLGPMSREMKGTEIDGFEKKYGYKPTPIRTSVDALAVFVNKDNPIKCLTLAQVDAVFSKSRRAGHTEDVKTWGQLGPDRRMGDEAHQPLRPQLGLRHVRLLQGARAQERRLQGRGEGAAGLGRGGPGGRRSTASRWAIAASATRPPASARCRSPRRTGGKCEEATADNAYSGAYPLARFLYVYVNKAPGKALDPLDP